jgi:hypothetical protein
VATSDAKDNDYLESVFKENNNYVEAIEKCVRDFPYGIH